MMYNVAWTLTVDTPHAATLQQALAPETEAEHATLILDEDRLIVEGHGDPGSCRHVLDDILACLTGAMDALETR